MKISDFDEDEIEYNEERLARFEIGDEWPVSPFDPAMRHVWIYECWLDEHGRVMEKAP